MIRLLRLSALTYAVTTTGVAIAMHAPEIARLLVDGLPDPPAPEVPPVPPAPARPLGGLSDLCLCGHARAHHGTRDGHCLVVRLTSGERCNCTGFDPQL